MQADISIDGLFVNVDAGFYSNEFSSKCMGYGIIANTAINPRNGNSNENILFDEELYENRYSIERINAWMDSYRALQIDSKSKYAIGNRSIISLL